MRGRVAVVAETYAEAMSIVENAASSTDAPGDTTLAQAREQLIAPHRQASNANRHIQLSAGRERLQRRKIFLYARLAGSKITKAQRPRSQFPTLIYSWSMATVRFNERIRAVQCPTREIAAQLCGTCAKDTRRHRARAGYVLDDQGGVPKTKAISSTDGGTGSKTR